MPPMVIIPLIGRVIRTGLALYRLRSAIVPLVRAKKHFNTSSALLFADDPNKTGKPPAANPNAEAKPSKPAADSKQMKPSEKSTAKPVEAKPPKPTVEAKQEKPAPEPASKPAAKPAADAKQVKPSSPKPAVEAKQAKPPVETKQAKPVGEQAKPSKPAVEAKSSKSASESKPTGETKQAKLVKPEGKPSKQAGDSILSKPVVEAARGVAKALGNDKIEGDLLGKLRGLADETRREAVDLPRLRNVLSDMRIEQPKSDRPPRTEGLPANLTKSSERIIRKPRISDSWGELKTLFDAQPLGIFSKDDLAQKKDEVVEKSLYDELLEQETRQMTRTFPRNAFEEQIQWTEDGKLWQFPIDNEAGWQEEASTSFVDHVFVERLLSEPQYNFPKTGPVRHFMELVCNGLSKNPYLPAKEKRSIVAWFANYFKDKYAVVERAIADSEKAKAKEAAAANQ